ncbi:TPA: DUF3313 domain-containing protein [Klebsiella pneumoniae]|nr:DUF3313 domain-containing protein [Klebsiella quasipneumoniae subsp. similipneumoniae]HBW7922049.1 DUF3313 domain-containing protein [Klebsiella pneumoniae]HCQ8820417.1 DUF3313 domain-containing protein [Klebsiella pneumoniae]
MRAANVIKLSVLSAVVILTACTNNVSKPEHYSGFLKDYSGLQPSKTATGKPLMRWVDPNFEPKNYDSIVYNPVEYYPAPKATTQIGQNVLDQIRDYTNQKLKPALASRKPIVTNAGPHSLIFRGAITAVSSEEEGLQFYEVIPVALVVASTQMATGHRTMNTHMFFEGEFIDATTMKPVIKVVRFEEGKSLPNKNSPLELTNLKNVIDGLATDITMFDPSK